MVKEKLVKERLNVIGRDDGKIRLVYWNKGAGENQIIFSKRIGRKIIRQLGKVVNNE